MVVRRIVKKLLAHNFHVKIYTPCRNDDDFQL